ncbi:unnamed protein product [Camellia sinensis]
MEYIDNLPAMDPMRSQKMTFVQLIVPAESSHRAVSYLGELGLLQFRDLNADKSPFQRTFVNQGKKMCRNVKKATVFQRSNTKSQSNVFCSSCYARRRGIGGIREMVKKYNLLHEHELIEMNHNIEKLRQTYNELLEFKMVLQKASGFLVSSKSHAVAEERELDDHVYSNDDYADTASLLEQEMRHEPSNQSGLRFISGIISKSKLLRFERMLFRATRGNMLFNQAPADEPILDPVTTEMVEKMVFVVFFSGEQAKTKTNENL